MLNIIISFLAVIGFCAWAAVGYGFWRYATWRASGPRIPIISPSDDTTNPFVVIEMLVWCVCWPLFALIAKPGWGEVDLEDLLDMGTDYRPLFRIFGKGVVE